MTHMITTCDKAVSEIVKEKRRRREAEQSKQEAIKKNWELLKKKGFGYGVRAPVILDYEEGRMFYDVMLDGAWKDQRCFIIGGGQSLKGFDFSKLKNEFVIGVNRAYEAMDCTIMFAMDHPLYEWITEGKLGEKAKQKFEDFKGFRVWLDSAGYDYPQGIFILNKSKSHKLSNSMKDGLAGESSVGSGALSLAVCLGANPIYLLGFDMKGRNGKQAWWHSGYPERLQGDSVYAGFINDFKRAAPQLEKRSIRVINLNPESNLKCFEFKEFKDVKPIKRPVITSYYTKGTGYEAQVKHLKITLRRFNLENDVVGVPDQGDWHKNVYYKAKFIKRMMNKHPGCAIVFVDADAMIRANPVFFNNLDCDFACHFRQGKELLSGTLYFGATKAARYLVNRWIEEDKLYPKTHMPQKNLRAVFDRHKEKIKCKPLPVEYCMIYDSRSRHQVNPVIEHFQLSRKYKDAAGEKYKYSMQQSLVEIREFCKGKRICLLGNADSVLREKRDIDSFDVVGRMNRGTPKGKEEFIGSRTDILFLSTGMSGGNIQDKFDPKYVLWMTACYRLASPWTLRAAIQNPKEDWSELYKKLSINPTTGMMALNFLLKHIDFKSLTIFGFDFFATKTWYNTKIDDGQKHSGKKEKALFMRMVAGNRKVTFVK